MFRRCADRAVEVEFGANIALLSDVVRANGVIAAYGSQIDMMPTLPFGPLLFKAITIDIVLVYILETAAREAAIETLHSALRAGALTPAIHQILPLQDAVTAHERVMGTGRNGAVLLEI